VVIEDVWGYRIAVAGVGAALVAFLIGAAIIAAGGNPVPTQYWSVGSGLAGGLLGILAPSPTKAVVTNKARQEKPFISHLAAFAGDIWNNRAVVMLLALFIVSVIFAAKNNSPELDTLAAAAGGALVGLLGPSPTSKQGG
jgi:Na+/melibiose symporter-like transporter